MPPDRHLGRESDWEVGAESDNLLTCLVCRIRIKLILKMEGGHFIFRGADGRRPRLSPSRPQGVSSMLHHKVAEDCRSRSSKENREQEDAEAAIGLLSMRRIDRPPQAKKIWGCAVSLSRCGSLSLGPRPCHVPRARPT